MTGLHIYLIAGEQSGDLLGASLMQALKKLSSVPLRFSGIGGVQMKAEGLDSALPISELALMGFVEILPHIPRLLGHIHRTAKDIAAKKPDVIITIDSPGFAFRVVKACRKLWPKGSANAPYFIHYVAPSVWAYKPERARKLAALYDEVLTLLPFEPAYFEAEGMKATFVGHSIVENPPAGNGVAFRNRHGIALEAPVVSLLPGSRLGEIKRHIPLLRAAVSELATQNVTCIMPYVPHLRATVEALTRNWPLPLVLADQSQEKWDAFAASHAALAKSGTVTLELSITKTPMVVFYKVNPLTAWLMRRMIITPFVTLVNVLMDRGIIPELLQEKATPENLANALQSLLANATARHEQYEAFQESLELLGAEGWVPSERAAMAVLARM